MAECEKINKEQWAELEPVMIENFCAARKEGPERVKGCGCFSDCDCKCPERIIPPSVAGVGGYWAGTAIS